MRQYRHVASLSERVRSLVADVTPLRESPEFRRLFAGETVSIIGTQMTQVAIPVQMYELTHSSLNVGLLGLAALIPLVIFGLLGGSIADAVDRRKLVLLTSGGLAALALLLVIQAASHWNQPWLLYVIIAFQSALFGIDSPARATFAPRLLPASQLPAVAALRQIGFNIGMSFGPLIAGVVIATAGLKTAYAIDVVSFFFAMYAVRRLPEMKPEGGGTKAGLRSVFEGFTYLRTQPVVLMTFAVDINAMVFGMPRALFPALAIMHFHGGPQTVGFLYSAPAIGALLGALVSGPLGRVRRQGWAVLISIGVWGLAITGFGLTSTLWLGLVMLGIAGAADMVSAVFRSAILQEATPDAMRGRLSGVFLVVVAGGPRLGDLEAGSAAALVSPAFSVISGGLASIAGVVLLGALVPSFARYRPAHLQDFNAQLDNPVGQATMDEGSTVIQIAEATAMRELSGP